MYLRLFPGSYDQFGKDPGCTLGWTLKGRQRSIIFKLKRPLSCYRYKDYCLFIYHLQFQSQQSRAQSPCWWSGSLHLGWISWICPPCWSSSPPHLLYSMTSQRNDFPYAPAGPGRSFWIRTINNCIILNWLTCDPGPQNMGIFLEIVKNT